MRKLEGIPITKDTIKTGDWLLAIRPCIMKGGIHKGAQVVTPGKIYQVIKYAAARQEFLLKDDKDQLHYFHIDGGAEKKPFFVKYVG